MVQSWLNNNNYCGGNWLFLKAPSSAVQSFPLGVKTDISLSVFYVERFVFSTLPCWSTDPPSPPQITALIHSVCSPISNPRQGWTWFTYQLWHAPPNLLFWCQSSSSVSGAVMVVIRDASGSRWGSSAAALACQCQLSEPHFWMPEQHRAAAQSEIICLTVDVTSALIKDQSGLAVKPAWICSLWWSCQRIVCFYVCLTG